MLADNVCLWNWSECDLNHRLLLGGDGPMRKCVWEVRLLVIFGDLTVVVGGVYNRRHSLTQSI